MTGEERSQKEECFTEKELEWLCDVKTTEKRTITCPFCGEMTFYCTDKTRDPGDREGACECSNCRLMDFKENLVGQSKRKRAEVYYLALLGKLAYAREEEVDAEEKLKKYREVIAG